MEIKNYGYIPDPIDIDRDYIFGGNGNLGGTILQPDGQWLEYVPQGETQYNFGFDTQACVSFGTLSACEILLRRMYDVTENFSDRFLAKASLTTPQGNSPQKVGEALRKYGVPREKDYPITEDLTSWERFYAALPEGIKDLAEQFLTLFSFNHEYVPTNHSSLKSALKYSPLGVAVSAWTRNEEGFYISPFPNNHWTVLIGYVEGKYWLAYDSYTDFDGVFIKRLAWDHNFSQAKRYAINVKDKNAQAVWYVLLLNNLTQYFAKFWSIMYGVWQR